MKQESRRGKLRFFLLSGLSIFILALILMGGLHAATPFDSSIQPATSTLEISANLGVAALWQEPKELTHPREHDYDYRSSG